ncbi:MAG: transposase [Anaerolineae bacterium]|nr:MAG: transposase [Anaerolineae bacterium]
MEEGQNTTYHRAFYTKLRPTQAQRRYFGQCAGVARFVYNWALADRIERYQAGEPTNYYEQKKRFNALKREQYPWLADYPYVIVERAFANLDRAYQAFFRRVREGSEAPGFPKFKSRTTARKAFCLGGNVRVEEKRVRLPRIGWVNLAERGYLPCTGQPGVKLNNVVISERAGEWYISAQYELPRPAPIVKGGVVAIHPGVRRLATLDDGTVYENPRPLEKELKRLAKLQRELARRMPGSANREKTRRKLARLSARIANRRAHALHNVSADIVRKRRPKRVIVQDWDIRGMLQQDAVEEGGAVNRRIHRAIADTGMGELLRQIEYKAAWAGADVVYVERYVSVNRPCSRCGAEKAELDASQLIYRCEACGLEIDRDDNAAKNLRNLLA